jgi:hypothetical protein
VAKLDPQPRAAGMASRLGVVLAVILAPLAAALAATAPGAAAGTVSDCTQWGTTSINSGAYIYQQNEWNSTNQQCAGIDTTSGAFSLSTANFNLPTNGARRPIRRSTEAATGAPAAPTAAACR